MWKDFTCTSRNSAERLNIAKACQAVNIRMPGSEALKITNSNNELLAVLYDSGQIKLKGTIVVTASTLVPSADSFIVRDDSQNVVAYIDGSTGANRGNLYVRSKAEHQLVQAGSNDAFTIKFEGVPVLTINQSGNLNSWNKIVEHSSFSPTE